MKVFMLTITLFTLGEGGWVTETHEPAIRFEAELVCKVAEQMTTGPLTNSTYRVTACVEAMEH